MDVSKVVIIWCDRTFESRESYQSMQNDFNQTTTATSPRQDQSLRAQIVDEGQEALRSDQVLVITAETIDDAMTHIEANKDTKIFVICSGTLGKDLVPAIVAQHPYVHDIYVYAHNRTLHVNWAAGYTKILMMFNFPTSLLVRLTRDISLYFLKQGQMHLQVDDPENALKCFEHAQKLELAANARATTTPNTDSTEPTQPDFRRRLDQLEGENGLIAQAEAAIHEQELPTESS